MSRRARQRSLARIAVAALLFAQALIAFANCTMPAHSLAKAIASANPRCHESSGETNLCIAHCLAADQSLDKLQPSVPQPALVPVLVQPASDVGYAHAVVLRRLIPPAAAPPPRILFRTLRI